MEKINELESISQETELVIFDFYNTLVSLDSENAVRLRKGAFELLARLKLKRKKTAIFSSSDIQEILDFPDFLKIKEHLHAVYGKENIIEEDNIRYKNLEKICKDLEIEPQKAVFIGDNYNNLDKRSAEKFNINFIKIPDVINEPDYNIGLLLADKK